MLNRPVSPPTAAPDASIGAASGSPEFGGAISTASMESNLSVSAGKADVMGAHQYFQGATGAESSLLGKMEITGLGPVGGDSSVTAALIAKVNEAISPVIGMIMKLPGALGFMHSLFEVLGSFLLGNFNLFEMLNPMMLGQQAAASFSKIGETLGHSLGSSLSLLPGHAPIFDSLGHQMGSMGTAMNFHGTSDFLSMKLNTSISGAPLNQMRIHETFGQKLNGIGSMNKPMFEQSGSLGHGTLSGPSLSGHSLAEQMAGHSRLFSDSLAQAGKSLTSTTSNLNSISANNAPSSFTSNANSSLTAEVPRLDTSANSQISFQDAGYKMSSQSLDSSAPTASMSDASNIGPSGRVPDAIGGNKIASNFNMNQSQFASSGNGAAQAASQNTNGLSGLKAKQLSFENLAQNQIKPHSDVPVAKSAPAASADAGSMKPQLAEAPKHIEVPKHHVEAPKHQIHHAPKSHARVEAPKHRVAEAPSDASKVSEVAQQATGEMQTYTIQRGDNLWNLAKEHLGDGNRWNEIYALNKDLIGSNPNLIHTGSHLNMPGAGGSEVAHTASATSYTVQPGDNLWNVSKKLFGEGKNWGDIYSMNKDVIGSNPSLIQPGQQLQINSGSETLAGANQNLSSSPASFDSSAAQAQGLAPGADSTTHGGIGAPSQMPGQDAQMQPAGQSEAMTPQVESMAPSANPNTISSVDPSSISGSVSQATSVANNAAYNNSGAVHAATLSKDLKSLFGS